MTETGAHRWVRLNIIKHVTRESGGRTEGDSISESQCSDSDHDLSSVCLPPHFQSRVTSRIVHYNIKRMQFDCKVSTDRYIICMACYKCKSVTEHNSMIITRDDDTSQVTHEEDAQDTRHKKRSIKLRRGKIALEL